MAKNSTFNISLKLLTQQFNKGLKNVERQLKAFSGFVKGAFAIGSIVAFGRKVVQTGAQFEDAMARVQAVSNATAGEMAMMTKEAEKLGATTKYTAAEAAGALENLTRNGLSASDATQTLSGTLQLAQANAIGLAEAADIITNTMNIFGLTAKDTNRINDVLSATCANSATNINLLAESIYGVGPIANMMGKSIEETSAALGVLANKGVKGSEAGKALGSMFQRLASQSPKAAAALKKYGLSIDESTLKSKSMTEVLQMLADSGIGESIGALSDVFGKNFAKTISILINDVDKFNEMLGITEKAAGTTARMFEQGVGSTENAIKSLQSAYDGLMNSIFKQTSGVLNFVLKSLTDITRALSDTKTRATAIIGAIVSLLTVKLVKAIQKVRTEAVATAGKMSILKAGITTVTAAAKAAYAAMGGWVGILMTIGTLIGTYVVNKFQKLNEVGKEMAEIESSYAVQTRMAANEMERLHKIAADENMDLEVRKKAIDEITRKVKDYHAEISKEGKLIETNKQAIANYIDAIDAEMKVQAKQAALASLYNKQALLETELLADAKLKATTGQKIEAGLMSIWMQMLSGNKVPSSAFYDTAITDIYQRDILKRLNDVNEQIKKYSEDMTPEELAHIIANLTGGGKGSGDGNGQGHITDLKDKLDKENEDYIKTIGVLDEKLKERIIDEETYRKEKAKAEGELVDAYLEYKKAIVGKGTKKTALSKKEEKYYEDLVDQYKQTLFVEKVIGIAKERQAKYEKKIADNAKKQAEAFEKLDEGLSRLGAKQGRTQVKNPWDDFSSNPREYRKEEQEVQRLQNELENLLSTYESLKDIMKDIGEPKDEKQRESLRKWNELLDQINQKTLEYQAKANALGSKKAQDEISEKTIEQRRAYYNAVRNTSSAVGTLASNLQSLADADWGTMSIADKFNTITNAIFGTIDAVLNVIDTFDNLKTVVEGLALAKKGYQAAEEAAAQQHVQNAEAEGAAELAKGTQTLAGAQMSLVAGEVEKAVQRGVVSAYSASAISGAASAMASIPYVGPILATAAATEMAAFLAATLPKFAEGGLVKGDLKYGDRLLARVNAGEMILNERQQRRLFDIADGRAHLGGGVYDFVISGKNLKGVLRNVDSATARIGGARGM